jgi:hypothetical protein
MAAPEYVTQEPKTSLNQIAQDIANFSTVPWDFDERVKAYSLLPKERGREPCPNCFLQSETIVELIASAHRPQGLLRTDDLAECKSCGLFYISNEEGWQIT